jgi:putative Ca2+/H+ antiporter (TMEM165/GDT1 family)
MIYSIANGYLKTFLISNLVLLSWNLLSILIGLNMQYYINRNYVEWFGIVLFAIFGFMMIKDGFEMENNSVEEEFLKEKEELEKANKSNTDTNDEENQISYLKNDNNLDDNLLNKNDKDNSKLFNSVWAFGFTLLMAEFGDKSQIAAIIIGATLNLYGVILGTSLAHSICTVIAIVFGRIFSHYVTTKQITMIGGLIFLLFSILFLIEKL